MGSLAPWHLVLIILAVVILFGYKKLPDASRSLGRSLRIFKGEMRGMKDDDVRSREPAATTPVRGEVVTASATDDLSASLLEEARAAEARAAELRARADRARAEQARASEAHTAEGPR